MNAPQDAIPQWTTHIPTAKELVDKYVPKVETPKVEVKEDKDA